jgi:hypothetical protein
VPVTADKAEWAVLEACTFVEEIRQLLASGG